MSSSPARPLAVVTGASSGIGFELAKQFATNGYDLVVAAEDPELHDAARELERLGASVDAVQVDLATDEGVDTLYHRLEDGGRPVDAVALNAGVGAGGAFATCCPTARRPPFTARWRSRDRGRTTSAGRRARRRP